MGGGEVSREDFLRSNSRSGPPDQFQRDTQKLLSVEVGIMLISVETKTGPILNHLQAGSTGFCQFIIHFLHQDPEMMHAIAMLPEEICIDRAPIFFFDQLNSLCRS